MKLFDEKRTLLSNVENKSKMRIEASSKMFEILSSKIYKYKPAAIVRELSSNCYDSHMEAGIPEKPFTVVLPSKMHSYVEFIDYGMGMSHDDVVNIFTVYGVSTKNNSNSAIGAFGMGAKTPFAYAKSFMVETVKDGIKRFYNLYLDESSEPSYSLQAEVETVEENGTKIKIPVREEHYYKFVQEAEFILSFFEVRPEIKYAGGFSFIIEEDEISEFYENGFARFDINRSSSELYNSYRDIYAVMGPVCYPIDFSDIGISSHKLSSELPGLKNDLFGQSKTVFIQFDIGELEVNASREALSIDEDSASRTVENIKKKVYSFNEKMMEEFKEKISEAKNEVEMLENLYDYNVNIFADNHMSWRYEEILKATEYGDKSIFQILRSRILKNVNLYKCSIPKTNRRMDGMYKVTPKGLFGRNGEKKKFTLIFKDVETRLNQSTWLNFYANNIAMMERDDIVVTFKGKKSDLKIKRLSKLIPGYNEDDFKVVLLSDLLEDRKRIQKEMRDSGMVDSISERPKTEFKAKANKSFIDINQPSYYAPNRMQYSFHNYEQRNQIHCPLDHSDRLYLYYDADTFYSSETFYLKIICFYYQVFLKSNKYKSVYLVRKTKMNAKRIKASGIENVDDKLKSILCDKKFLRLLKVYEKIESSDFHRIDSMESGIKKNNRTEFDLFKFLEEEVLEDGLCQKYFDGIYSEIELVSKIKGRTLETLLALDDMFIYIQQVLSHSPLKGTEYLDNILGERLKFNPENNGLDKILQDMPMLRYVSDKSYLNTEDRENIKQYFLSYLD